MYKALLEFVRDVYRSNGPIPLHAPVFRGHEKRYVVDAIDSTFVSSAGEYVDRFENDIAAYVGSPKAVSTVNGTAALHVALRIAGVGTGDIVLTQAMTFVATCNAIMYCGARPLFIDVDRHTLSLSASATDQWLSQFAERDTDGACRLKSGGAFVRACLPMHTFGHPAALDELLAVCDRWGLALIEDAAESLGSTYKGRYTGTLGKLGILSFNGNKILTTGGGGMILANVQLGERAKFLTTTAKTPHRYEYVHEEVGYNYRMPNINAALGCAQFESLDANLVAKRKLAHRYASFFKNSDLVFIEEPEHCSSNYWLNGVVCADMKHRNELLDWTNDRGIGTRPVWRLMHRLPAYAQCLRGDLANSEWLEQRIVNLPSSVPPERE